MRVSHVLATPIDEMTEYALEELLSGNDARRRGLVHRLCARWPEEPALAVSFALTSAAAMLEDNFGRTRETTALAPLAWKMAAVFAADVFAAERISGRPAKARDLRQFWRRVDPWFLEV